MVRRTASAFAITLLLAACGSDPAGPESPASSAVMTPQEGNDERLAAFFGWDVDAAGPAAVEESLGEGRAPESFDEGGDRPSAAGGECGPSNQVAVPRGTASAETIMRGGVELRVHLEGAAIELARAPEVKVAGERIEMPDDIPDGLELRLAQAHGLQADALQLFYSSEIIPEDVTLTEFILRGGLYVLIERHPDAEVGVEDLRQQFASTTASVAVGPHQGLVMGQGVPTPDVRPLRVMWGSGDQTYKVMGAHPSNVLIDVARSMACSQH